MLLKNVEIMISCDDIFNKVLNDKIQIKCFKSLNLNSNFQIFNEIISLIFFFIFKSLIYIKKCAKIKCKSFSHSH